MPHNNRMQLTAPLGAAGSRMGGGASCAIRAPAPQLIRSVVQTKRMTGEGRRGSSWPRRPATDMMGRRMIGFPDARLRIRRYGSTGPAEAQGGVGRHRPGEGGGVSMNQQILPVKGRTVLPNNRMQAS